MQDNAGRPDPDALLENILEEEKNNKIGKLKVFFGMAAGVGKTYAMLEESHRLLNEGKNLVIGYVETHGRKDTDELTSGIRILPRKPIPYESFTVDEFDIDLALSIHPEFIVIDELAHTNAQGSRHEKRYQDVIELLDNGINVLTTVNIQHLESQADIVEKISGVKIRETLPDSILERADQIELVDITSEELLKRLKEGKVYIPERAGIAANNFFKPSNIIALRERTLHYMTRIVDRNLDDYTVGRGIRGAWKSGERILVAVSPSPYSEYLLRWTRRMAFNAKVPWIALYIEKDRELSAEASEILHRNMTLAEELGAEVISTSDEDIVKGLLRVAEQKNVTQIIAGKPLRRYFTDYFGGNLVERLLKKCGDIEIHIVTQPKITARKKIRIPFAVQTSPIKEYFFAFLSVMLMTGLNLLIVSFIGYWAIALIFLLFIALLAVALGRGPILFAAALSAMAWNFLFIPPLFTLRIDRLDDVMMFGMYFVIASILGSMTSKLRIKERALRRREKRLTDLYDLSTRLDHTHGIDEIASVSLEYVNSHLDMMAAIFIVDESGVLQKTPYAGNIQTDEKDSGVADWVFRNSKPAGLFTKTLPGAGAYFLPLRSPSHTVGVFALRPRSEVPFGLDTESFIRNIASQIAIRFEHEMMTLTQQKSLLIAESERLHKILLNTISHELRTPLTAITGASSGLLDDTIAANPRVRNELAAEIHKASDRLNHLVDNLLDMSRLESGVLKLNRKLYDVHDLLSVAFRRLKDDISSHTLKVSIPEDMPLVSIDFPLMEQVVTNLLYNAVNYTPAGSEIEIVAVSQNSFLNIAVRDNGPGLFPDDIPHLFEKFRRGKKAASGGTGLGLSICKGIIEAHGGTINAMNRPGGGAVFVIEIPLEKGV
jgi:two-component system, OmpR family, sensor histidine kinase KdpD